MSSKLPLFRLVTAAAVIGALAWPAGASAQGTGGPVPDDEWPSWVGQFTVLGVNSILSGLSAGVLRVLRGGSFEEAFVAGMAGGAVSYAGKRIAVEHFAGAGLAGRQVAAIGSSMARNAGDGQPVFERMQLPFGPVRLYIDRSQPTRFRAKMDLNVLAVVAYALAHPELRIDLASSASAGAPVFRAHEHRLRMGRDTSDADGTVLEGVVILSDLPWRPESDNRQIFAHERIHVIQADQVFTLWTEPVSARLARSIPGGAAANRFVDLHATSLLILGLRAIFTEYDHRPWEMEARYLAER